MAEVTDDIRFELSGAALAWGSIALLNALFAVEKIISNEAGWAAFSTVFAVLGLKAFLRAYRVWRSTK